MSYQLYLREYATEEELEQWDVLEQDIHDLRQKIDKALLKQSQLHNRAAHRRREDQFLPCKYCHTKSKGTTNCSQCGAPR